MMLNYCIQYILEEFCSFDVEKLQRFGVRTNPEADIYYKQNINHTGASNPFMLSVQCMQSSVSLVFSHSKVGQMGLAWQLAKVGSLVLFGLSSLPSCCPETKICKNHGGATTSRTPSWGNKNQKQRYTSGAGSLWWRHDRPNQNQSIFLHRLLASCTSSVAGGRPGAPKRCVENIPGSTSKNNPKVCLRWGYKIPEKTQGVWKPREKETHSSHSLVFSLPKTYRSCPPAFFCWQKNGSHLSNFHLNSKPRKYTPESLPQRHCKFSRIFGGGSGYFFRRCWWCSQKWQHWIKSQVKRGNGE